MASSGNTWCKKLMAKGKRHALGKKLGTFKRLSVASSLDETKPTKQREHFAPVKYSHEPRKPKGRSGCKLNDKTRAILQGRREARDAFIAALQRS